MKVYRLLCDEELELIKKGRVHSLGKYFEGMNTNTTHRYKTGERYLHFFFRREDCEFVRNIHRTQYGEGQDYFLAEFNIPLKSLIGHIGKGFYSHEAEGNKKLHELAIPASIFMPYWLKNFEKVSLSEKITKQDRQPE